MDVVGSINDGYIRKADRGDGKTPRERGYWHSGEPPGGPTVHLDPSLAAAVKKPRYRTRRPLDGLLSGWDAAARQAYSLGLRDGAVWRDQAWRKLNRQMNRLPLPPRPCQTCTAVFVPQRATGRFCSNACRQKAKRERARHANSVPALVGQCEQLGAERAA